MRIPFSVVLLAALPAAFALASPDVEVSKWVDDPYPTANQTVEFTIEIHNRGDETALDVLLVDQLPPEMMIPVGMAAFTTIGNYDPNSGEWDVGDLVPSAGGRLVIPAIVIDPQPPQCVVNYVETVSGDIHGFNNIARAAIYQGTDYRCVDLTARPSITAGNSIFPECDSMQSFQGSVLVRNFGPDDARDVVLSLTQSPISGAEIRFEDSQCEVSGLDVCTISLVRPGPSLSLNITSDAFQNYTVTNHLLAISISTTDLDYDSNNNFTETDATIPAFSSCEPVMPVADFGPDNPRCFIATAAYGTALDPRLVRLRDFRDRYLMTNRPGRAMIRFYYRYSPPLAEFIADRDGLRAVVRGLLTPVVLILEYPILATLIIVGFLTAIVVRLKRRAKTALRA